MTRKEFDEIVSEKVEFDEYDKLMHDVFSIKVARENIQNDKDIVLKDINVQASLSDFEHNLAIMYQLNYFTEEQWNILLLGIVDQEFFIDYSKFADDLFCFLKKWRNYASDLLYDQFYLKQL
jgi:hypothetical protein